MDSIIYLIIFLPMISGIILQLPLVPDEEKIIRHITKFFALITLILTAVLSINFDFSQSDYIIESGFKWINVLGINASFQIDSISLLLVILLNFILLIIVHISKGMIKKDYRLFYSLLQVTQFTGIAALFVKDMFLFFTLQLVLIVPMYIILLKWCNLLKERTANLFLVNKSIFSVLILLGFLLIYFFNFRYTGILSSDISDIDMSNFSDIGRNIIFYILLAGFIFNLPVAPFHKWYTEAVVNAPASVSVFISAIMVNIYSLGIIKYIFQLFSEEITLITPLLYVLLTVNIIYAVLKIIYTNSLKQILAYTGIISTSIFLLGLFSLTEEGITGSIFQLISYSFIITGLYITANSIFKNCGTYNLKKITGLGEKMPKLMYIASIFFFACAALPLLCGFNAIFLSLSGAFIFQSDGIIDTKFCVILSLISIMISGFYIIKTYLNIFTGEYNFKNKKIYDIKTKQLSILFIISIIIILTGIIPSSISDIIQNYGNYIYTLAGAY